MKTMDNKQVQELKQLKKDVKSNIRANRREIIKTNMAAIPTIATAVFAVVGGVVGAIAGVPALAFAVGSAFTVPSFAVVPMAAGGVLLGASVGQRMAVDTITIGKCRSAIREERKRLKTAKQKQGANESSREVNKETVAKIEKISADELSGIFEGAKVEPVANLEPLTHKNVKAGPVDLAEEEAGSE